MARRQAHAAHIGISPMRIADEISSHCLYDTSSVAALTKCHISYLHPKDDDESLTTVAEVY